MVHSRPPKTKLLPKSRLTQHKFRIIRAKRRPFFKDSLNIFDMFTEDFEIFGVYIYIVRTYVYHSYCACIASSAIFEKKLNGKQAQRVAGIKLELAILQ